HQFLGAELVAFQLFETAQIHHRILFPENVRESTLRKTPVQRHLAALESAHHAVAGNGFRALRPTSGILAAAGTHALADPLFLMLLPRWRLQIAEIHALIPPRSATGAEPSPPSRETRACPDAPPYG